MKVSDKIANCSICINYAKKVDKTNWQDLYQKAWLKVREKELREPDFIPDYYKSYFYSVLRNTKLDEHRKQKSRPTIVYECPEIKEEQEQDPWVLESSILHEWLKERVADDYFTMLKQIADLTIRCKTVRDAAKMQPLMSERTFYKNLNEAKKEIDYAHFLLTDCHPLSELDMVRDSRSGTKAKS